jgi:hypothetical protein
LRCLLQGRAVRFTPLAVCYVVWFAVASVGRLLNQQHHANLLRCVPLPSLAGAIAKKEFAQYNL